MNAQRAVRSADRKGIAAFFVLLLLSLTLSLGYAMMRSQSVAVQIQRNACRLPAAQQDAITGITLALKQMTLSTWTGVSTVLNGTLGPYDTYQVSYTAGDPTLAASSSSYGEYPYRVTLLSTGSSVDPSNVQNVATYQVRAVVRLVPRALATEPSSRSTMMQYAVYQYQFGTFDVVVPSQIQGSVYTQAYPGISGQIWPLDSSYDWSITGAGLQYYGDLKGLKTATGSDWRPFTGALTLMNYFLQPGNVQTVISGLGLTVSQYWLPTTIPWNPPASMSTYQIYPGGPQYQVQVLAASLQATTLQPSMTTNPLGIYFRSGPLDLYDNTTIQGTVITAYGGAADVTVHGKGIALNPVSLPALYNTTTPIQLPVVVSGGNFKINANAGVAINGQASVASTFDVVAAGQAGTVMTFLGQLVAGAVSIEPRTEWTSQSSTWWSNELSAFNGQKNKTGGYKYFPQYLQKYTSLNPVPQVVIKPSSSTVQYHWQVWTGSQSANNPIFVPASGDGGLRWDLVSWTENPS